MVKLRSHAHVLYTGYVKDPGAFACCHCQLNICDRYFPTVTLSRLLRVMSEVTEIKLYC